jgi:hypothetical protein
VVVRDETTKPSADRSLRLRFPPVAITLLACVVASCAITVQAASAREPAVRQAVIAAHGSVDQVYVTGLQPHARASLFGPTTHGSQTLRADTQGGIVFRNVKPATGYHVRIGARGSESAPITVHAGTAKPWDPAIYHQHIADHGYQYLRY